MTQDFDCGTTSSHQQPALPDIKRQAAGQPDRICRSDAIRADDGLLHCQEVPLPTANEPVAVVAALRLLGDKAGLVVGGGDGQWGGSNRLASARAARSLATADQGSLTRAPCRFCPMRRFVLGKGQYLVPAIRVLPMHLLNGMPLFLTVSLLIIGFCLGSTDGGGVTLLGAALFLPYVLLAPLVIGTYLIRDAPGSAR